jgi:hypothetical protein
MPSAVPGQGIASALLVAQRAARKPALSVDGAEEPVETKDSNAPVAYPQVG